MKAILDTSLLVAEHSIAHQLICTAEVLGINDIGLCGLFAVIIIIHYDSLISSVGNSKLLTGELCARHIE